VLYELIQKVRKGVSEGGEGMWPQVACDECLELLTAAWLAAQSLRPLEDSMWVCVCMCLTHEVFILPPW